MRSIGNGSPVGGRVAQWNAPIGAVLCFVNNGLADKAQHRAWASNIHAFIYTTALCFIYHVSRQ